VPRTWSTGDHLTHRFNAELGIGRIAAVEGRTVLVEFPDTGAKLRFASNTDALLPVQSGGRPQAERSLIERLAAGDVDDPRDLIVRLALLQFLSTRQADGLGSFLGGRVRLFPHQLYVAERATAASPVRWLLADEVGLGKTIEACLILNRLVHAGTVERCLIVAPYSLTVQWLGELWRKYHQVFTLVDDDRLKDVARDFGPDFNPFDVYRRSVIALEMLVERPHLTAQAVAAGIDLLIVDEAQRLKRPPGHPGEPAWRAVAPIADLGRHVLLLSATPLEDDVHGFLRLVQLLHPEGFPDHPDHPGHPGHPGDPGDPANPSFPPCTSSTRRRDIGGLPERVGVRVEPAPDSARRALRSAAPQSEVERTLRSAPALNAIAERRKVERIQRACSSGAALSALLGPEDDTLRQQARSMDDSDWRIDWLLSKAPRWREAGEKTLIFVAYRETLEMVRSELGRGAQLASGVFHEELSVVRRDIEVARFRDPDGPSLLVSTESGGEGRNFEFCRRLVLFDLPWTPTVVEQRIGRLDRIGRRDPVEVVYFRPPGVAADVVRLYEALGLFREPLAGLEPQLAQIEEALAAIAVDPVGALTDEALERLIADVRGARTRIQEAAYQQLHRDPYRAEMAEHILVRVPADLDALVETCIVNAATRLGFQVDRLAGRRKYAIEFGNEAVIDSLPGVAGGASFVGTFDREEAVQDEMIDFFASGHPLVEGVIAHAADSRDGRVGWLHVTVGEERGEGIALIYADGPNMEIVVVDSTGRLRPEWGAAFHRRPLPVRPLRVENRHRVDWAAMVAKMQPHLAAARQPQMVAAVVVG
jgi:ATP-dependent helicase HepA